MAWACAHLALRTVSTLKTWVSITPVRTEVVPTMYDLSGSGNFFRQH